MADVGTHHFVKNVGNKQVLVPQPSNDSRDPLNWSLGWKLSAIVAANWSTFCQGFGPLALAPMFPYYVKDFNCTLADAVQFTGVCILVLGFSNFIWCVQFLNSLTVVSVYSCVNFQQGPPQHILRPTTSVYRLEPDLHGFLHLARSC